MQVSYILEKAMTTTESIEKDSIEKLYDTITQKI
ncbi:unnamed protein product, partial [Rotaria magnacalcarata]